MFIKKKIDIAILGLGAIGQKHIKSLLLNKYYNIKAVVDKNYSKNNSKILKNNNIKKYSNIDKLIKREKLDYVSICLPSGLHYQHIIKILKSNINVICEKPLVLKSRQIRSINKLKSRTKLNIYEVKQLRYSNLINKFKDFYLSNKFGKINFINFNIFLNRSSKYYKKNSWRGTLKLDGGVLFNQLSHYFDIINYIFNPKKIKEIKFISNKGKNIEFEDSGAIIFKFNNKTLVNLNFSIKSYKKNYMTMLNSMFDKANISIEFSKLNTVSYCEINNKKQKNILIKKSKSQNLYKELYDDIYFNLMYKKKSKKLCNITESEKTISLIEKIYKIKKKK